MHLAAIIAGVLGIAHSSATQLPAGPAHAAELVDVFQSGQDGDEYWGSNYSCYRIPVLVTMPNGNVALFAEGRFDNCNDLGGHTDVVVKVSTDKGRTWSKLYVVYGESTHTPANPTGTRVTIGNPAPVVVDGRVLLLCSRNAQRLLRLRSLDATGLTWPKTADDITVETFKPVNVPVTCMPGALGPGGDLRRANTTVKAASAWCCASPDCGGFTAKAAATATCAAGSASSAVLDIFFKSKGGGNSDHTWTSWVKPVPPGVLVVTGPPGGMVLPSGRIVSEYYTMAGPSGSYAGALISDDHGATFTPSADILAGGGEGAIALAPNGSLILNSRGRNNTRFQSASSDGGLHWTAPRALTGYGSPAEGSMIRMVGSDLMLFSHAGNVNGTGGRWNMTIWASRDSAESWTPAVQVEPDAGILLHLAYSCLLQLSRTDALVVWERGPMGGNCRATPTVPHCFRPSGEYQTLRVRRISFLEG